MDSFRLDLESVNSNGSASHYRGPFIFEARSRNRSKLPASSSISYQLIELNIWYYFITSDVSRSSPEQNNNRQQSEQTPTPTQDEIWGVDGERGSGNPRISAICMKRNQGTDVGVWESNSGSL